MYNWFDKWSFHIFAVGIVLMFGGVAAIAIHKGSELTNQPPPSNNNRIVILREKGLCFAIVRSGTYRVGNRSYYMAYTHAERVDCSEVKRKARKHDRPIPHTGESGAIDGR